MKTILITGAEGMIGSALKRYLEDHNYDVTMFAGDVTDQLAWSRYIEDSWNYIIHLAALAGVRPSFKQPEIYYHNNVNGTALALDFAEAVGAKMLYASSSNAYEWWGNPYAATKKMNEVQAERSDVEAIGMRFHTVWPGREDMLYRKLQKNEVTYINRFHTRDFIHIDDLVEGIRITLENFDQVYSERQVVDYGTGHSTSVESVAKVMGFDGQYRDAKPVGERVHTKADIEWLLQLGWTPKRNILNEDSRS